MTKVQVAEVAKRVPSRGHAGAKIMVVGEAPGAEEIRLGQPFVGASGRLLEEMLSSSGIDPRDVWYANLCQVRPPGNELRAFFNDKGVPNEQVIEGLGILKGEIEAVKPNVIIPLGNYPFHFLTGHASWKKDTGYSGIGDYRGYLFRGTALTGGAKCLPTYHPAAVLRNYPLKHIARLDFSRAAKESVSGEIRYPKKSILLDAGGTDREAWLSWLIGPTGGRSPLHTPTDWFGTDVGDPTTSEADSFLTVDIEYIGSKLLCVGLTRSSDLAVVIPTQSATSLELVRTLLLSGVPLCFQNGMFDCSILEWFYDIPCIKYIQHDTFVAMHSAYTEFKRDLGFIGSIFETQYPWWHGVGADFWKQIKMGVRPETDCFKYNGGDVWNTHHAMKMLLADELTDPKVMDTYRHEMALIRPLWEIGKRGVPINVEAIETLKHTLETEISTLDAGLDQMNGAPFNANSPPQVAKFLFEKLGCPVQGKTPAGARKTDDSTLATLALKVKDPKQISAITMLRKTKERKVLISKFCDIDLDSDRRMRCHYDPAKTDTGRLASRKFYPTGNGANLQNIPRDTRVRAVFLPDPGYVFGYADLKSAESLIVAHITGDPEMLRLHSPEYMSGELDGHKYVASQIFSKPQEKISKEERHIGKTLRHAGNYGMSWAKFQTLVNAEAQKTGISVTAAESKAFISGYRQLHHMLPVWWTHVQQQLWTTHTIFTRYGRPRVFYGRPDEILPEAIAYDPQGTVARNLNMGLLRCSPEYSLLMTPNWMRNWDEEHGLNIINLALLSAKLNDLGFQMLLQVHDAIGFQIPTPHLDEGMGLLRELMTVPVPISRKGVDPYEITIPVEIQVGSNWGEFDPKNPDLNPNGLRSWKPNQQTNAK